MKSNNARVRTTRRLNGERKPKVLCLLPGVPLPANTGGNIRALTMVQALDRAFDTTVLSWNRAGADPQAFDGMLAGPTHVVGRKGKVDAVFAEAEGWVLGSPLGYPRYGFFPPILRRLLTTQKFDAIHFDHPHTALAWRMIRKLQPQAKLVMDAHNVEAEIIARLAEDASPLKKPLLRWQSKRIESLETEVARQMDLVFACSEKDAQAFRAMGAGCVRVVPNAIPPLKPRAHVPRRDVVFVGSLDWKPNADAALILAKDIWPLCREKLGGARLVIVGRNPPANVAALASDDVLIPGSVPAVQPFLDASFATAIPLKAGSGTRIKILEAWAAGVPVVASRIAAEGLPYTDASDLLLAEEPREFADALVRLYEDKKLSRQLCTQAKKTVRPFTAEHIGETVAEHYLEELGIGDRRRARAYSSEYEDAIA